MATHIFPKRERVDVIMSKLALSSRQLPRNPDKILETLPYCLSWICRNDSAIVIPKANNTLLELQVQGMLRHWISACRLCTMIGQAISDVIHIHTIRMRTDPLDLCLCARIGFR